MPSTFICINDLHFGVQSIIVISAVSNLEEWGHGKVMNALNDNSEAWIGWQNRWTSDKWKIIQRCKIKYLVRRHEEIQHWVKLKRASGIDLDTNSDKTKLLSAIQFLHTNIWDWSLKSKSRPIDWANKSCSPKLYLVVTWWTPPSQSLVVSWHLTGHTQQRGQCNCRVLDGIVLRVLFCCTLLY